MNSLFLKRALLVLCVFSNLTATFAMEMPENENRKQKIVQKISEVAEDELCDICYEGAKALGEGKLRATNCPCDKFICSDCVKKIKANAAAKCPFCRGPLTVRPIKLKKDYSQQKAITIVDRDGNSIVLSGQESAALLKCEVIENMVSEINDHRIPLTVLPEWITLSALKKLIECCDDIKIASKYLSNTKENIALFKVARYFCAPTNIVHFFANAIWLHIQEEPDDSQDTKDEKKRLRLMAESHLANPGHLAAYARYHGIELQNKIVTDKVWYCWHIDISYAKLVSLLTRDDGWYQDDDGLWYSAEFKFGSLKGLKELLAPMKLGDYDRALDVSGHALKKCDVKEVVSASYAVIDLILNNNLIEVVDLNGIALEDLANIKLQGLTIKDNPVVAIDDSFYRMIHRKRNKQYCYFSFVLKSNALTGQQKKEIRNKFYQITHITFLERFINQYVVGGTMVCGGYGSVIAGLVGTAAVGGALADRCKPNSFKANSLGVLTVLSMLASMPISGVLCLKFYSVLLGGSLYHDGSFWDFENPEYLLGRIYAGQNFKISIE
jgi:hypothetical protein